MRAARPFSFSCNAFAGWVEQFLRAEKRHSRFESPDVA
jgi:hypothetical protein